MTGQVSNPLAHFGWTRAALAAFPADATPHLVVGYARRDLAALAPFVKKRLHGVVRLFFAGASELCEPADFVWTDGRTLAQLIRALARGGTPLVLEHMPADSLSLRSLKRAYRGRAIVVVRPQPAQAYIALDETWLEPQRRLNAMARAAFTGARRAAEALGHVATAIHTPDLCDLAELLDTAFDVERGGPVHQGDGTGDPTTVPLVRDPQRAMFYRQYAQSACVEGILRICFLRIGDRAAAMQLAVEQGGAFWVLRSGFDRRYADCLPGWLLARDTIRYAAEAGLTSYEFLSAGTDWTGPWTTASRPYVTVRVYPLGVRGMMALAADSGVALYGRWRKDD